MRIACLSIVLCLLAAIPPAWAHDCSGARDTAPGPGLHSALFKTQKLIDASKTAQAAKELDKYAKDNPDEDHYLLPFTQGVLAFQLKQRDKAGIHFQRASELNPCYSPAWRNLAVVRFEQGKLKEAAGFMRRAYDLSKPPDDQLLYETAALYLAADQPQQGLPLLVELASRPKPKKDWLRALVQAYLVLKKPAQAEPVLKRLLAGQPGDAALWRLLAVIGQEKNDPAAAAAALGVAYGLEPPKTEDWRRLAELHLAAGAPARAAVFYRRAFGSKPSPKNLDLLAMVYIEARDFQAALETAQAAVRAAPTAKRWARLGEIHLQARRYAPAMDAFCKAAKLKDGQGRYALLAGQCAMQLERYEEARNSLRAAVAEAKKGSNTAKLAARSLQELERFLKNRQES